MTAVFDNSKGNPANPNAEVPVRWGPQSTDEMLIGYVEYFVADPEADPDENPLVTAADAEEALHGGNPKSRGRRAKGILQRLDRNQDGRLTREELPERYRALFDQYDADHDGFVS